MANISWRTVAVRMARSRMHSEAGKKINFAGAVELENVGIFQWDIVANRCYGDANFARIYGFRPDEMDVGLPIEVLIARVHPHDRDRVARALHQSILSGEAPPKQYRIVQPEGPVQTVLSLCRFFRRREGVVTACSGVVFELSESRCELLD